MKLHGKEEWTISAMIPLETFEIRFASIGSTEGVAILPPLTGIAAAG